MRVLALNCNQCGAPLEVPAKARFVTCTFCNVRLQVQREGRAAYTEALEDIAEDVREIKHKLDVEQLDREWEREREGFLVTTKHGHRVLPTRAANVVGIVLASLFAVVWLSVASSTGAPSVFVLFGVLVPVVGIFACVRGIGKAGEYERALERYRHRRLQLLAGRRSEDEVASEV